jgi:hypothetical protein
LAGSSGKNTPQNILLDNLAAHLILLYNRENLL